MHQDSSETLIIGAGLVGSSVAWHLARLGMKGIRVVDFDLEGTFSSSELNAGGVRATWMQPANIEFSKRSIEFFESVAGEVGFRSCGYLWLKTPEKLQHALKAREKQVAMGWPVETWDIPELRRRIPFIDKTDDLGGAVFAPRDGLLNPNRLKSYFREKARELGVVFEDRVWVRGAEVSKEGVVLLAEKFESPLPLDAKEDVLAGRNGKLPAKSVKLRASRVMNCAGPWAPEIAKILGYHCPSKPVRRQVCIFDCRDVDLTPYGMIVDSSGVYFHPEATNGLAGFADPAEPAGASFAYDGEKFFMEQIWPALYERSTKFERLKHQTGWAGLYEVSPDESGIIGAVSAGEAGRHGRVFEAHSFSGHGVMHSYSAGLALAELIVKGRYDTLDATPFSGARFETGRQIPETLVI